VRDEVLRPGWILLGLVVAGAALRLHHLGYKSLWVDEANLYWIARGTLSQVMRSNAGGNSAPPLFAVAIAAISRLGESEAALRALSCAAGIAALPAIHALARQLLPPAAALFATLLATLSPGQVVYSQQVREYSLAVLLAALLLAAFVRFLRLPSLGHACLFGALAVLGIFVQYGLALLLLALNLALALEWISSRVSRLALGRWTAAQLAALAAVAAVHRLSLGQQFVASGFGASYLERGYWNGDLASLPRLALANTYDLFVLAYPAAFLLQFLVLLGALRAWRTRDGRIAVLLLALPMLVTLAAACLRFYPYLGKRQCLFLTPMIFVAAGFGFQALLEIERRALAAAAVTAWLALQGLSTTWEYLQRTEPQHLRPVVEALRRDYRDGDRVYVYHGAVPAFRYYDRASKRPLVGGAYTPEPGAYERQIDALLEAGGRLWLVMTNCRFGECRRIRDHTASRRPLAHVWRESDADLYLVR
jgi:uncharacterized membrane protein